MPRLTSRVASADFRASSVSHLCLASAPGRGRRQAADDAAQCSLARQYSDNAFHLDHAPASGSWPTMAIAPESSHYHGG